MIKVMVLLSLAIYKTALAFPNLPIGPRPIPPIPPSCSNQPYENLSVGNGQAFSTINQALEYAKANRKCRIILQLKKQDYIENIQINQDTQIVATASATLRGSIQNMNGYNMSIQGLKLFEAKPYGIKQVGGRFELKNSQIISTSKVPNQIESGIGVILENVKGSIENTEINLSQTQALHITGERSVVAIRGLSISNNNWDPIRAREANVNSPDSLKYIGAFEVANGATVNVESSVMDRNKFMVFNISQAARVNLNQVQISNTQEFDQDTGTIGGQPALVHNKGTLRAERVIIDGAVMGLTSHASFVSLINSRVQNVAWGVAVQAEDPEFSTYNCTIKQGSDIQASQQALIYLDMGTVTLCKSEPEKCAIKCP